MIITYLTHDLRDIKACSLICHSWYPAAAQHLHHTFTLRRSGHGTNRSKPEPLSKLDELGLLPLVKEIRVDQGPGKSCWFVPWAFNRHFFALANVHTLKLDNLEIHRFTPDVKRYLGHFSLTLQSIALYDPSCTPQQLSHFLSLFSNLDDIEIRFAYVHTYNPTTPNTELVPYSAPKLRGRLVLSGFSWAETLTRLIAASGGLRFRHIDLGGGPCCAPLLLKACAETLETLRFDAREDSFSKQFCIDPSPHSGSWSTEDLNLSHLKVLRSLQIKGLVTNPKARDHRPVVVVKPFLTITSPVFSELVIIHTGISIYLPQEVTLFETLRKMNEVRHFKLVFSVEAEDERGARRELAVALDSAAAKRLLDFLNSPPTIRTAPPRYHRWDFLNFN